MNRQRGFTLLEVLIALSLLGVLMLLVGSSIAGANRTIHSSSQFAERLDEIQAAERFVRDALQTALPLPLVVGGDLLFQGEAHRMQFVARAPLSLGSALRLHQLEIHTDEAGTVQLRAVFITRDDARALGEPQILVTHLRGVHLAYRGLDEARQPTGWLPRWPWPSRLPTVVRIEADAEGPVRWPVLTVALRTAGSEVRP